MCAFIYVSDLFIGLIKSANGYIFENQINH